MSHWGFWELLAYSGLWIGAIIIAADGGLKMASEVQEKVPRLKRLLKNPWWAFAPLLLVTAATVILVGREFGILGASTTAETSQFIKWPSPYTPISVIGKTFRNEVVLLDGYSYSNCEFYNVKIKYNGTTPIQVSDIKIFGPVIFASDNQAVLGAFAMMIGLGFAKDDIKLFDLPSNLTESQSRGRWG